MADSYYSVIPTWAAWTQTTPTAPQTAEQTHKCAGCGMTCDDNDDQHGECYPCQHESHRQSGPTYTAEDIAQHVTRVCDIHNGGPSVYGPVDVIAAVGILSNGEVRCLACLMSEYYYTAPHADGITFQGYVAECAARMDGTAGRVDGGR